MFDELPQNRPPQILFGRVVVEQSLLGDTDLVGNGLQRRPIEPVTRKETHRCIANLRRRIH
jgi:hypothetical protein